MKLNGSLMVAVAMLVGALAVTGCSKPSNEPVAPEDDAVTAPVDDNATPGFEQDARRIHYYGPHAPPAARYESPGRAPSNRHFWSPGYHRWSGREYTWYPGRWYERRDRYEYVSPHWENRYGRWEYIPGHWARHY